MVVGVVAVEAVVLWCVDWSHSVLALIGLCEVATRHEDVPEPRLVRNASRIYLGA